MNTKLILSKITEIRKKFNLELKPFFDLEMIVKDAGLEDIESVIFKNPSVSGYIDFKDKKIYVNKDNSFQRKRFTIAHELGHLFLHLQKFVKNSELYSVFKRDMNDYSLEEKEANFFAANLLVPKELLNNYLLLTNDNDDLSKIFGVSNEVIRRRRDYLNV